MSEFNSWKDVNDWIANEATAKMKRAVRMKCLDCCGWQPGVNSQPIADVQKCEITDCPLHAFRYGNPFSKRKPLTEEQKETLRTRMAKARESV